MTRPTYHHGDLRRALLAEAFELAGTGGPEAVTLREVARRLDVSPTAIYRHFPDRDALLGAVASLARQALARRMLREIAGTRGSRRADLRAARKFIAVGRAYLDFGQAHPNLLAVAFLPIAPPDGVAEEPNPWSVLAAILDELVASGAMPQNRRAGAETIAWSMVHGFAVLRASGALGVSAGVADPDDEALLDAVARSLEVTAEIRRVRRRGRDSAARFRRPSGTARHADRREAAGGASAR